MLLRSLAISTILAGQIVVGEASAQMILCPEAPKSNVDGIDSSAEIERLLQRLTIALDLDGYRGISHDDITELHTETPKALLAKLSSVVDRCSKASEGPETFYEALPELRDAFLEATGIAYPADADDANTSGSAIRTVALEPLNGDAAANLSIRELWRKLWFRSPEDVDKEIGRWAVIVASPSDIDSGWEKLGQHQRRWKDAYFQLHIPYHETNPHYAIVVGRRLPRDQAVRLRDYAIELGMAEDAYIWPLPIDGAEKEVAEAAVDVEIDDTGAGGQEGEDGLDLSILDK